MRMFIDQKVLQTPAGLDPGTQAIALIYCLNLFLQRFQWNSHEQTTNLLPLCYPFYRPILAIASLTAAAALSSEVVNRWA
jgi:hypothetical protein